MNKELIKTFLWGAAAVAVGMLAATWVYDKFIAEKPKPTAKLGDGEVQEG